MPNQIVSQKTQSILSSYETISESLRLIDSLSWLMVAASDNLGDDTQTVSDTMQIISRLAKEAHQASKTLYQAYNGGNHE